MKRHEKKLNDFTEGMRLFDDAPDDMLLERRWGISFHISLADLQPRCRWVGPSRNGGYWLTPSGR